MTKENKITQKLKIMISKCIPNGPEGQILRDIIFRNNILLPNNKILLSIFLKYMPELWNDKEIQEIIKDI